MSAFGVIAVTILISYLVGAIPFGYLIARTKGVDILHQGSGNIGATNVGRVLGRRFGILVFLLDFAKGAVPVAVALGLRDRAGAETTALLGPSGLGVCAGLAAFLGHLFPVYLRFRGGKGVATSAGVVAVLLPWPALGAVLTWVAVVCSTRYVSLASLVAAVVLCGVQLGLMPQPFAEGHAVLSVFCLIAAGLVVARHHANIKRLLHGTENRLPDKRAMLTLAKTIHVLALGLWFGTTVFFSFVVALTLFSTFEALTVKAEHRPFWLPAPVELVQGEQPLPPPSPWFPDPLTKEQGSRIAGAAVGPMFPWYFGVQVVCGVLALATAGGWYSIPGQKVHKVRMVVLALAVAAVAVGWWLEREVEALRVIRSKSSDAVLTISRPVPEDLIAAADKARADFGRWHGYSLLINFATLLLVTVGMALAAQLPSVAGKPDTALAPPPGENILRLGDASTPQPRVAGP